MDNLCIDLGTLLDRPDIKTLEGPEQHSLHWYVQGDGMSGILASLCSPSVCAYCAICSLLDISSCVASGYNLLKGPSGGLYSVAYRFDAAGTATLVALGRDAGVCGSCTGKGTQVKGFRAEVTGVVTDAGSGNVAPTIRITSAKPSSGRSNFCAEAGPTSPVSAPVKAPQTAPMLQPTPAQSAPVAPPAKAPAQPVASVPVGSPPDSSVQPVGSPAAVAPMLAPVVAPMIAPVVAPMTTPIVATPMTSPIAPAQPIAAPVAPVMSPVKTVAPARSPVKTDGGSPAPVALPLQAPTQRAPTANQQPPLSSPMMAPVQNSPLSPPSNLAPSKPEGESSFRPFRFFAWFFRLFARLFQG
jgi:hypothetical protein